MLSRHISAHCLLLGLVAVLYGALQCVAYIPALPVNDTSGLNFTDSSTISISWTSPAGVYSGGVSYQLMADVATGGTTAGALVHFAESTMGDNATTTTPWIAFISCDVNETTASDEWDIFTLARDRGAVSALLYTTKSQSCLLNSEYISDFEKPLDVFATKTVQVARVIDNQYVHTNETFENYNGTLLNESAIDVNNSLVGNAPSDKTYLIGTLTARNSTGQATGTDIPNASPSTPNSGSSSSSSNKKTSAPMIVLYTVTGVVSCMFLLMLAMGARRAMRNPEQYGRRENEHARGPQSAAGGLAQAMLDTFPVIKFRRSHTRSGETPEEQEEEEALGRSGKRIEDVEAMGMVELDRSNEAGIGGLGARPTSPRSRPGSRADTDAASWHTAPSGEYADQQPVASGSGTHSRSMSRRSDIEDPSHGLLFVPNSIGDELAIDEDSQQCSICLVEFEDGDDVRVLPCEKSHSYHQACIDPWLLEIAASCPLCRKDFNSPDPRPTTPTSPGFSSQTPPVSPSSQGFARYLRWKRRDRHPSGDGGDGASGSAGRRGRARSGASWDDGVGPGRRREADQTGPGGY